MLVRWWATKTVTHKDYFIKSPIRGCISLSNPEEVVDKMFFSRMYVLEMRKHAVVDDRSPPPDSGPGFIVFL